MASASVYYMNTHTCALYTLLMHTMLALTKFLAVSPLLSSKRRSYQGL